MTRPRPNLVYYATENKNLPLQPQVPLRTLRAEITCFGRIQNWRYSLQVATVPQLHSKNFKKLYVPSVAHTTGGGEGLILGSL